jgi:ParB family chromosome partitioning protein
MAELVESIRDRGVIQPLLVRRVERGYEVIAGERRLRAAREAGIQEIPVVIWETDSCQSLEMSIIENVQREDLNPIEEASAYQKLLQEFHLTQEEIAAKVRKDRSTVANLLRLLSLPEKILGHVRDGSLSVGHARALLALESTPMQLEFAQEIIQKSLSVREVERLVCTSQGEADRKPLTIKPSPFLAKLTADLQRLLSTRVRIRGREDGKGKIEIEYYSRSDLERILSVLSGGN